MSDHQKRQKNQNNKIKKLGSQKSYQLIEDIKHLWQKRPSPEQITAFGTIILAIIGLGAWAISRDTEHQQLRAYLGVTLPSDIVKTPFTLNTSPVFHFSLKNSGQTPAFKTFCWANIRIDNYPMDKDFKFEKPHLNPVSPIAIFPGDLEPLGIDLDLRKPLTEDEILSLQEEGNRRIYTYGRVLYQDAFKEVHYTNFCFAFSIYNNGVKYEACSKYNDAS